MDFHQKIVLITGASSGIGEAVAREFAKRGANLVLTARRLDRLHLLAEELKKQNCSVLTVVGDVTRDGDLEVVVQAGTQKFGRIDIVIANAGFGVTDFLDQLQIEDYRRQFETNVFGVLRTIYASLTELKKSKGVLVLLGSVAGYVTLPGSSPYSMSKFAIHALARTLGPELKEQGISVVLIAPGFVDSEFRQVDNKGKHHATVDRNESLPAWLIMPTEKAAYHIVNAIKKRKKEEIITFHGKVAIWVQRHIPKLINFFINCGLRSRSEPSS